MSDKKKTGSYYTPKILSDFLSYHVCNKYLNNVSPLSVLEPSCGDGQFISSLFKSSNALTGKAVSVDLFDIDKKELNKALAQIPESRTLNTRAFDQDYLQFSLLSHYKYNLIIGNPPYINKKNMKASQIKVCEKVHGKIRDNRSEITSVATIKNIWTAFIEAAIMDLDESGVLCLVIPSEILQVKYASELRALISSEFDRVEIFAFNELIFDGIQQDVIALVGVKGIIDKSEYGFSFYQVEKLEDLKEPFFTEKHSNIHRTTLDKWTNYILSDEDLTYIDSLRNKIKPVKSYCDKAEVGIVSAANSYFLLTDEEIKENGFGGLKSVVKPILPKGFVVSDLVNFTVDDFNGLKRSNKKVNFLHFPNIPKNKLGKIANKYLAKGEEQNLHQRYKMLRREHWYHVPCTWKSEALFIKRCHLYPKILINEANVLATDSFYRIQTKDEYSIKNLVFSFYNSLTFVLSELEGRFYGGGVLELTPNEFKSLSIPYLEKVTDKQFKTLDDMLRKGRDIEQILEYTNSIIFHKVDVERLEKIRKKLVVRRLKKKSKDKLLIADIIDIKQQQAKKQQEYDYVVEEITN
jgi:adenine-specific DNA-methyltransferase